MRQSMKTQTILSAIQQTPMPRPQHRPEMRHQGRDNRPHHDLRDQERADRPGEQMLIRMLRMAHRRLRDHPIVRL